MLLLYHIWFCVLEIHTLSLLWLKIPLKFKVKDMYLSILFIISNILHAFWQIQILLLFPTCVSNFTFLVLRSFNN